MKSGFVYILTNLSHRVLYTGTTSNLIARIQAHKEMRGSEFTVKYKVGKLVFFQEFDSMIEAIQIEKKIKAGSRQKKVDLIQKTNPLWKDLSNEIASAV